MCVICIKMELDFSGSVDHPRQTSGIQRKQYGAQNRLVWNPDIKFTQI